jgi:hypothetical protein
MTKRHVPLLDLRTARRSESVAPIEAKERHGLTDYRLQVGPALFLALLCNYDRENCLINVGTEGGTRRSEPRPPVCLWESFARGCSVGRSASLRSWLPISGHNALSVEPSD